MSEEEPVSPQREELLRYLLPQKRLEYDQESFPGAVRLELVRRTRVVLRVREMPMRFHLPEEDHGTCELQVEASRPILALKKSHPALWELTFHIAAEAMLALRNGHKEYTRVSARKRRSAQAQQADVP